MARNHIVGKYSYIQRGGETSHLTKELCGVKLAMSTADKMPIRAEDLSCVDQTSLAEFRHDIPIILCSGILNYTCRANTFKSRMQLDKSVADQFLECYDLGYARILPFTRKQTWASFSVIRSNNILKQCLLVDEP